MRVNRAFGIAGIVLAVVATLLFVSWGLKSSMTLDDFDRFYKSPEYPAQYAKQVGGYEVKIKVRPSKYHFYKMTNGEIQRADSLIGVNDSIVFMDMKIVGFGENSPLFEGDQQLMEERLMYYMSFITEDLWLESEDEIYTLINHHVERNYNITNSVSIQMAFHKPVGQDFTFVYNDRMLEIGTMKLKITARDLNKLPNLSL